MATATPAETPTPTVEATPTPTTPATPSTPSPTPEAQSTEPRPLTFDTPPGVYTAITVGASHACALTESGEAVCWNVGSSTPWETPPGPHTFIAANDNATCAVSSAGEIACWLSPGSEWGVLPEEAPPGKYVAVSMDRRHACALTEAGEAVCWGPEDSWLPLPVLPPGNYTTISIGQFFGEESDHISGYRTACATTIEGDLVCWRGINIDGRVEQVVERISGNYTAVDVLLLTVCTLTAGGGASCEDWDAGSSSGYTALAVGVEFVCALTEAGTAGCGTHGIQGVVWGDHGVRWLMNPTPLDQGRRYVAIGVGDAHACALTDAGEAVCWGSVENKVARPDPAPGGYVAVSDGYGHTCALTEEREAVCWGWNNFGQVDVPEGSYSAIGAGFASTCALTEAGRAVCWGALQRDLTEARYQAISAGYEAACALTEEGEPVCFGDWLLGEAPSGSFTAITLAWTGHACALGTDGEVVCWGEQSRDGRLEAPPGPWVTIDAGEHHTCAITDTGEAACWGNPSGELPNAPVGRYVAVSTSGYEVCVVTDAGQVFCRDVDGWESEPQLRPVGEGLRALDVSIGLSRTCTLTDAGAVVCWGDTEYLYSPFLNRHGYQPSRW